MVNAVGIGEAVPRDIIPCQQFSRFGLEAFFEIGEARCAAGCRFVEVNHHRPCALSVDRTIFRKTSAVDVKIVGVGLKLFPQKIALSLKWFAIDLRDASCGMKIGVERTDDRIMMIHVTSRTGTESLIAIRVDDGGWNGVVVNKPDQPIAHLFVKELR